MAGPCERLSIVIIFEGSNTEVKCVVSDLSVEIRAKNNPPVASAFPTVGCRIKIFARINFFIQSNKLISLNFQKVQYQKDGIYSKFSGSGKGRFHECK